MSSRDLSINFRGALDAYLANKDQEFLFFSFDYCLSAVSKKEPEKTRIARVEVYMPCLSKDMETLVFFLKLYRKYGL